ncbi:hypothetical protein GF327_00145 [Candidatus Woesearchaeota archaeon]|nr:hypothetical protein [Candidatus Woesearchaeota archaeon]
MISRYLIEYTIELSFSGKLDLRKIPARVIRTILTMFLVYSLGNLIISIMK